MSADDQIEQLRLALAAEDQDRDTENLRQAIWLAQHDQRQAEIEAQWAALQREQQAKYGTVMNRFPDPSMFGRIYGL